MPCIIDENHIGSRLQFGYLEQYDMRNKVSI